MNKEEAKVKEVGYGDLNEFNVIERKSFSGCSTNKFVYLHSKYLTSVKEEEEREVEYLKRKCSELERKLKKTERANNNSAALLPTHPYVPKDLTEQVGKKARHEIKNVSSVADGIGSFEENPKTVSEKPFKCPTGQKRYLTRRSLNSHTHKFNYHSGEASVHCTFCKFDVPKGAFYKHQRPCAKEKSEGAGKRGPDSAATSAVSAPPVFLFYGIS